MFTLQQEFIIKTVQKDLVDGRGYSADQELQMSLRKCNTDLLFSCASHLLMLFGVLDGVQSSSNVIIFGMEQSG